MLVLIIHDLQVIISLAEITHFTVHFVQVNLPVLRKVYCFALARDREGFLRSLAQLLSEEFYVEGYTIADPLSKPICSMFIVKVSSASCTQIHKILNQKL